MFFELTKSILLIVTALFPIVNPIGGSPVFLLLTQDCRGHAHPFVFRHFVAGCTGWRRTACCFDRLGDADAE